MGRRQTEVIPCDSNQLAQKDGPSKWLIELQSKKISKHRESATTTRKAPMDEPNIRRTDPSHLRLNPIRHESLPQDVLDRIGTVYRLVGRYLTMNLEQFEISFMRETYSEVEVATWCWITAAWQDYHQRFTEGKPLTDVEEENIVATLVLISMGVEDPTELSASAEMCARLVECFRDAARRKLD
jgi:hypothetical protein